MNRLVSSTSRTYNCAMRYYSNLINLNESEWLEYRLSDYYDDDEFEFRMFFNQLKRSKVINKSLVI